MVVCIKELKELPPLSNSAREILKIANNDDVDVSVFTDIVERDPALMAKLIGLANSAYFGSRLMSDLKRAVIDVLGYRMAKNVALGLVLGGIFNPRQCRGFDLSRFWFVSMVTATLTKELVSCMDGEKTDANDAFLSGLLNEIGMMALAYLHPQEMDEILLHAEDEQRIYEKEMEIFGKTHYALSAQLLATWHLPQIVCQIMGQFAPDLEQQECGLCKVIRFARGIAVHIHESDIHKNDIHKNDNHKSNIIDMGDYSVPDVLAGQEERITTIIDNTNSRIDSYQEMARLLS